MSRSIRVFFAGFVLLLGIGALRSAESTADVQPVDEIQKLLDSEKREMDQLREKIARQEHELSAIGKKETSVLKTLGRLENRLKLRERELRIYKWNIEINKKQMENLSRHLHETQFQLARQQSLLGLRLRTIYKEGGMVPIKILFSADGLGEFLRRFKYMESVMAYDSAVFRAYETKLRQLQKEQQALLKVENNLHTLENAATEKKGELESEKEAKSSFLKKISTQKTFTRQARKELIQASEELNQLIARLQEKLVLGKGLNISDKRGRLRYPVAGPILNQYGRHRDRKYGTFIVHNGIDLKVPRGTSVKAIFHGKVQFAGTLEGYGNLVILGHGDNYHSLYGHLEKIHVEVDDFVEEGATLGLSGDTGSLYGPTLYLEIRHQGKPIEPTGWFHLAGK